MKKPESDNTPVSYPKCKKNGKLSQDDANKYILNSPTHKALEKQIADTQKQIAEIEAPFKQKIEDLKKDSKYQINESDDRFTRNEKKIDLKFAIDDVTSKMNFATGQKRTELRLLTNDKTNFENTIKNWENTEAPQITSNGIQPAKVTLPDGMKAYRVNDSYFMLNNDGTPGKKLSAEDLKKTPSY